MQTNGILRSLTIVLLTALVAPNPAAARVPVEDSLAFDALKAIASEPKGPIFYRICKLRGAQYNEFQNANLLWVLGSERPSFGALFMITPEGLLYIRNFEMTPSGVVGGDLNVGTEIQRRLDGLLGGNFGFKFQSILSGPDALETIFSDRGLEPCLPIDVCPETQPSP